MIASAIEPQTDTRQGEGLSERLEAVHTAVGHVLQEVRLRPVEARRFVTRELGIEPRADALRAIVAIAREYEDEDPRGDLPRQLLALRVLVDRELAEVLDSASPDPGQLRQGSRRLADLQLAVREVEADIAQAVAETDAAQHALLLEIAEALAPCEERLIAATVLAPRLESLLGGVAADEPEMLGADGAAGLCRVALNAVALETLIEDDLRRLAELDAEPQRDASGRARHLTEERLRAARIAYRVVAAHLRDRQQAAIDAGLEAFAEELSRIKARLFGARLRLSPVSRRAPR